MIKKFFICVILISDFFGCEGKQGPVGPLLTGDIVGSVRLIDTSGNSVNPEGTMVQLEGTSYSTISDSIGIWKLRGVQTGTYIISCSKQGFSTNKNTSFPFVGGTQPADGGNFDLYQCPTRFVKSLSLPQLYQNILTIVGQLSSTPVNSCQIVYTFVGFDSSALVLSTQYLMVYDNLVCNSNDFTLQVDINSLKTLGAGVGSKLYFVSFTIYSTYAGYVDVRTRKFILTGLCQTPSNIVSIVVP